MKDQTLRDIAVEHGTPTYVYDLDLIAKRYHEVADAFHGASVHYAVKANGLGAILRHLRELGAGAEALTLGELERALRAGFEPARIVLGGPGHDATLAARAAAAGVAVVSIDSRGAWEVWRGVEAPDTRFLVRLNPAFDPKTHEHLATAAAHSKFGVPVAEARDIAEEIASQGRLSGFHVHAGSMLTDPAVAELIVGSLEPLYQRFDGLDSVDFGGGFAVPDAPLERFAAPMLEFAARHDLKLIVEPGRYLVAEAGVLLTRVMHTKSGGPVDHVIADAGMADLLRPALYGAQHPIRVVASGNPLEPAPVAPSATGEAAADTAPRPVDVDGPLCENADRLGRGVELGTVSQGALLAVEQAGAYGYAMSSNYASSLRPAQVVVQEGRSRLASRREVPEDLWRLEDAVAAEAPRPGAHANPAVEAGENVSLPGPDTALAAPDVLALVLRALRDPDRGTAVIHRFAGDALLAKVGTLDDLRRTFSNELFEPLTGDHRRDVLDFDQRGTVARATVSTQGATFIFNLARRAAGRHPHCWLITAVARDLPGA